MEQLDFSKYKNSKGQFVPAAMYREKGQNVIKTPPCLTLKPEAYDGLISAYDIYMNSVDEYDAGTKLCPTYADWVKLTTRKWFNSPSARMGHIGLEAWREHMRKRDESLAKSKLQEATREMNVTAAKALLAESKPKANAGRRTKKAEPKGKLALVEQFNKKRQARK